MRARDNPFRTDRVLALRFRPQDRTWERILEDLETLRYRAAIVGPQGSGKTTLLEDLAPRLVDRGFAPRELRLTEEFPDFEKGLLDRVFASLGPRDILLFDGAEQLGRLAWSRFERRSRAAGGLLITSHRPGLLPTLIETSTTPDLLDRLVEQILGERAAALRPLTPRLFEKHGGNLREALRDLYDHYAAAD